MAKTKLTNLTRITNFVAPTVDARVTRLVAKKAELSAQKTAIETELKIMGEKLVRLVREQGEPDAEGKIKAQSDDYNLQIIPGKNVRIDAKLLAAQGVKPSIIKKATIETPFEYVGVYPKKAE